MRCGSYRNPTKMSKKTNALRILDSLGIPYALFEYRYDPDNLSVEKIAAENGLVLERIFKTLVTKSDSGQIVVAVTPGDKALNFKVLAQWCGAKKIALADTKDLLSLTGYQRGGCSPVGMKKEFPVCIDRSALEHERIFVNAGMRGLLAELAPADLQRACKGEFISCC
jgi:Cys-tRNA(Pro)/Cys-tRNA(Cys) deacylase